MKSKRLLFLAIAVVAGLAPRAGADFSLGTAANFAILAGTTVTNTGATLINGGDVGVYPGSSITGFGAGSGTLAAPYQFHAGDAVAALALQDLATAYNLAVALKPTQILTGQDLGGLTLTPGVYSFATSAQLSGMLTLNDLGNPNAQFVFQIGTTLTTALNSSVVTRNGNLASVDNNVFWQVGSSATIGTDTAFEGHILADTSINLSTDATLLNGSALAINGAVTLDTNQVFNPSAVPEPGSLALVLVGGTLTVLVRLRKRSRSRAVLPTLISHVGPSRP
jgi:hypothetical protein